MTIPQYAPMIPTQVPEPFHRDGWVYEEKVDGWRILAYKDGARVRLLSRTGASARTRPIGPCGTAGCCWRTHWPTATPSCCPPDA